MKGNLSCCFFWFGVGGLDWPAVSCPQPYPTPVMLGDKVWLSVSVPVHPSVGPAVDALVSESEQTPAAGLVESRPETRRVESVRAAH